MKKIILTLSTLLAFANIFSQNIEDKSDPSITFDVSNITGNPIYVGFDKPTRRFKKLQNNKRFIFNLKIGDKIWAVPEKNGVMGDMNTAVSWTITESDRDNNEIIVFSTTVNHAFGIYKDFLYVVKGNAAYNFPTEKFVS